MKTLQNVLFAIAWVAALVATVGAALLNPTVMGVSGIVAAAAALLAGLIRAVLKPDRRARPTITLDELFELRAAEHARQHRGSVSTSLTRPDGSLTRYHGLGPAWDDVEEELPYRLVERRPHWDTNIMGAPE